MSESPLQPTIVVRHVGTSGYAIASLVVGVLWIAGLGSILAIVFGILGRRECDRGEATGRGMATAGLVIGVLGLLLVVAVALLAIPVSTSGGVSSG